MPEHLPPDEVILWNGDGNRRGGDAGVGDLVAALLADDDGQLVGTDRKADITLATVRMTLAKVSRLVSVRDGGDTETRFARGNPASRVFVFFDNWENSWA